MASHSYSAPRYSGRGRPPISAHQARTLIVARAMGHTLQECAELAGVSVPTANNYTWHVPNNRRLNSIMACNRRNGKRVC